MLRRSGATWAEGPAPASAAPAWATKATRRGPWQRPQRPERWHGQPASAPARSGPRVHTIGAGRRPFQGKERVLKREVGREARALSGRLCVQHLDSQPKRGARRVGDSCAPYLVGAAFLQVNSGSGAAQDSTAAPRQHSGRRSRKLACAWEGRADQVACLDVMQQSAKRACMRLTAWGTLSCQACKALQGLWLLGASWSLL